MREQERCSLCVFWRHTDGEEGLCLRYAPLPTTPVIRRARRAVWPLVVASEWCGEWARRTEADYLVD